MSEREQSLVRLGVALRGRREDVVGVSLREVARRVGISPGYLSRLERGVELTPPSGAVLCRLATVLGMDADVLHHLAGRLPDDVEAFLLRLPGATAALRALSKRPVPPEECVRVLREAGAQLP